jgi:uncharacterized protein (UPF0248 family)
MIPALRHEFNSNFTRQKYRAFLDGMERACGTPVKFRLCETPCFFPKSLLDQMCQAGRELIEQLVKNPGYHAISNQSIPPEFNVPHEDSHPLFIQVDFGLIRDAAGHLQPRLVELQGFPSLYAYQAELARQYIQAYDLNRDLCVFLRGLKDSSYANLLRRAIVADHDPENVILMEIDPQEQKTLPDFILTERMCGITAVCVGDIEKDGRRLFYRHNGRRIPIHRIYNRAIVDELVRKGKKLAFSFRDELDVEWAGHPNWFFRLSKFSLPYLHHACVPQTCFLDRITELPNDLDNYILKPLYSFAGLGIVVAPTREQINKVPPQDRSRFVLQERLRFEPLIETPAGKTQAEVRIMYVWLDELLPVLTIVRMGRGVMMGVDHNRDLEWVGASAAFFPPGEELALGR